MLRVEGHVFVEQDMGHRCHTHRGTGVTGVGSESSIDLNKESCQLKAGRRWVHAHIEE